MSSEAKNTIWGERPPPQFHSQNLIDKKQLETPLTPFASTKIASLIDKNRAFPRSALHPQRPSALPKTSYCFRQRHRIHSLSVDPALLEREEHQHESFTARFWEVRDWQPAGRFGDGRRPAAFRGGGQAQLKN